MKENKGKRNNVKLKYLIKDLILLVFFALVYLFSTYKNGFKETNIKLLTLFFYAGVGFVGAIIIYIVVVYLSRLIGYLNAKKREKLLKKLKVVEITNSKFSYDYKKGIPENFNNYLQVLGETLKSVATSCGYKGKYLCLNFTLIDALYFVNNTLNILENKIDNILTSPALKFFKLQDKPIGVIESTLNKLVDNNEEKEEKKGFFSKYIGKPLTVGITFLFKETIDKELNKVVDYVGTEWCLIYGKNNKKLLKKLAKNKSENTVLEVVK